jgi:hypothetical protein
MRYLIYDNVQQGAGIGHTYLSYHWAYKLAKLNELDLNCLLVNCAVEGLRTPGAYEEFFGLDNKLGQRNRLLKDSSVKKIIVPSTRISQEHHQFIQNQPFEDNVCFHVKWDDTAPYNSCGDFSDTIDELKARYRQARTITPYTSYIQKDCLNVAVHIRRGNILQHEHLRKDRASRDDDYVKAFQSFKQTTDLSICLNIYTQGRDGQYLNEDNEPVDIVKKFDHENTHLYMDTDTRTAFDNIVNSDVVIYNRSGFPLIALELSNAETSIYINTISGY